MEKVHYNITIRGKVQGVWFRKYTKDEADRLRLGGLVRNEPNGDVYTEAEGAKTDVIDFIEWLYAGSPRSEVKEVVYEVGEIVDFEGFEIRR
ncbi:MAG: acylphosphatase [Bacteroidota bacterium]